MLLRKLQVLENLITERSKSLVLLLITILAVLLAIKNAFIQDDAFISFRYAYNLIHYNNFSWNEFDSVKIEGYTNFLWTALMAICIKLNLDPVICSQILGILLGIGTLITTYKIATLIIVDYRYALLSVFLLGTNYSFSAYMTGGLETQLQTFLIALISFFSFKAIQKTDSVFLELILVSFFSGLAILTRLDSPLIIGILVLSVLYCRYTNIRSEKKLLNTIGSAVVLTIPVLIIVLPWIFWKYNYYGDILPNSFYLKSERFSIEIIKYGVNYLLTFFYSYYFIVFCFIMAFQFEKIVHNKFILTIIIIIVAWCAYIIKVGGDFMEFRFLVPILPLFIIAIVWSIKQLEGRVLKYVCIIILLCGTVSHEKLFFDFHGIESINKLHAHISEPDTNWKGIGVKLNDLFFNSRRNILIATTAAGAIPYYSKLSTIDMLGVNDKWIALHGDAMIFKPGHRKWSKIEYYLKTNVNLIIGHPQLRKVEWSAGRKSVSLLDFENFRISALNKKYLPADAKVIEIPIDERFSLFSLYLKPTSQIDSIINKNNIKVFNIE